MATHSQVSDRGGLDVAGPSAPGRLGEVLRLWLHWNEEFEHLAARMFQVRHDQVQVEDLADAVDVLRQRAVAGSREILREMAAWD